MIQDKNLLSLEYISEFDQINSYSYVLLKVILNVSASLSHTSIFTNCLIYGIKSSSTILTPLKSKMTITFWNKEIKI